MILRTASVALKLLLAVALVLAGLAPGAAAGAAENGAWADASIAGGTHLGQSEIGPELASGSTLAAKGAQQVAQRAFAPGQWLRHFEKHGAEFGYKNSVEYLRGAQRLTGGGKGVLTHTRATNIG